MPELKRAADRQQDPSGTAPAAQGHLLGGLDEWRATVDEDGHYLFAVAL
jgi:hypothetical protein